MFTYVRMFAYFLKNNLGHLVPVYSGFRDSVSLFNQLM